MIRLGGGKLTYDECYDIIFRRKKIVLDDHAQSNVYHSYFFLKEFIKDKHIYGINTGFGPMAQYKISDDDQVQLQYNLIRSHCSGSGKPIDIINVRALILGRLNTLMRGY